MFRRLLGVLLFFSITQYHSCDGEPNQVKGGLMIVTHLHYSQRSGVLVAYKPPETAGTDYSPNGGLVDRCVIYFATGDTRDQAKNSRDKRASGQNMTWSTAGGYYYYEDDETNIFAGTFYSITFEMLSSTGNLLFIDCLTAVLNSPLIVCEAEKDGRGVSRTCSSHFALLGIFTGVGQTEVDLCAVISRSNRSLLETSTQTTNTNTASVTTLLSTVSNSNTQKEDTRTITSTGATSSLSTSTASHGVPWTIIIAAVVPTLILSVTIAVIIVKVRMTLIAKRSRNDTIDSFSTTDDPYYSDVISESSFNTYDTPASHHFYHSIDDRSGQAVAAINHGYDGQEETGQEGMYGGSVNSVHSSVTGQEEGIYGGSVYSLHSSETSAN